MNCSQINPGSTEPSIMSQHPRYLYKYRSYSKHTLDGLRSNSVWFSSANSLNDPFDSNCRIDTRVPSEDQRKIGPQIFAFCMRINETRGGTGVVQATNDRSLPDDLKFSWLCKEFARSAFQSSVYALTADPLHPLMWAHYGSSYSGFVVGFDTELETDEFWFEGPRQVSYAAQPPSVDIRELVDSEGVNYTRLQEFEESLLSTKAAIWKYEAEWRLVANQHASGLQPQPYEISQVIVGYRMPTEQRNELMEILGNHVNYEVAVPDLLDYSLRTIDPETEDEYLRDFDRSLRTLTHRTEFIGTAEFLRHDE